MISRKLKIMIDTRRHLVTYDANQAHLEHVNLDKQIVFY